jgi:conjugative relaxase-like TrwC/TraI family protein
MLRIVQNSAADRAKSYYSSADYYSEGQELVGRWRGKGAARLGLRGEVDRQSWDALCDNLDPTIGETLTPRQKRDRRVGYDFNFHAPKSVSLLYGLTRDERILDAFRDSVGATMQDMEAEMKTRVRAGGRDEDRTTGNMVWGEFVHFTARPVDGLPDPHLHAHCFVFNTTWDGEESRWKAGQFAGLKRDAPYFEAVFHSRLARRLEELGLAVERTKRGWELAGVPASAVKKFSRRTALIEEAAREQGVTDADAKGELGAKTRERKRKDLSLGELQAEWTSRLTAEESGAMETVSRRLGGPAIAEEEHAAAVTVARAVDHCLERSSVVPERKVLAVALKNSTGTASPEAVHAEFERQGLVSAERNGRRLVTTRAVLAEERRMIDFARSGRGTCRPLARGPHCFKREWLNEGQRRAVQHVLQSRDRVILVRGAAGVGKTSMMQEAVEAIEASGRRVFTFAPSADASRGVLRSEGFANADTVARLLKDERMQSELRGQVIWIDEAGLLGTRTTAQVFDLASRLGARAILSGDRRQHGSVERGAALRQLEEEAGLAPAEIKDIQRQKGDYRQAVQALGEGRTEDGFDQLDRLGWIREVDEPDRYKALARDYVATVEEGKSALVVSPTHLEAEWITVEIRSRLKSLGRLGAEERQFRTLANANLTEAEKADAVNYEPGDVLVFHQNARGFAKGQRTTVGEGPLPLDRAERYQVFHAGGLALAPGDVVRITGNGTTADGRHRLNNGALYRIDGFTPEGNIVLNNGWTVDKDFGHLAYGYVLTSHASQGKTVDRVFIGQSSDSLPAASREQFYVSVSRGREGVTVYTDDKEALLAAVSRSDERLTATEFLGGREMRERGETLRRLEGMEPTRTGPSSHPPPERERIAHEL